jgi:hypothetical protein
VIAQSASCGSGGRLPLGDGACQIYWRLVRWARIWAAASASDWRGSQQSVDLDVSSYHWSRVVVGLRLKHPSLAGVRPGPCPSAPGTYYRLPVITKTFQGRMADLLRYQRQEQVRLRERRTSGRLKTGL